MGGRAGGGASGGIGKGSRSGGRDYVAEAGFTDKDIMRVMKSALRKNGLDAKYNAKQAAKAAQQEQDFNTVVNMLSSGKMKFKPSKQ